MKLYVYLDLFICDSTVILFNVFFGLQNSITIKSVNVHSNNDSNSSVLGDCKLILKDDESVQHWDHHSDVLKARDGGGFGVLSCDSFGSLSAQ